MAKKNLKSTEIDETALDVAEEAAPEAIEEELVDFEAWYAARQKAIPAHHHKEIIRADFKGRKVPEMATMAIFDDALKKYGVKL